MHGVPGAGSELDGLEAGQSRVHKVQLDLGAAERHLIVASNGGLRAGDWLWQKTI